MSDGLMCGWCGALVLWGAVHSCDALVAWWGAMSPGPARRALEHYAAASRDVLRWDEDALAAARDACDDADRREGIEQGAAVGEGAL